VGVLGALFSSVTFVEEETEAPEESVTVAVQEMTSFRDAMLLSNVRVEDVPKPTEVVSFIHTYEEFRD
jgi:hypothetical protein